MKKKLVALLLALTFALSLAACGSSAGSKAGSSPASSVQPSDKATSTATSPVAGKKIAYVMLLPSSDIFQLFQDSVKTTAAKLGMEASVYFCDGDFNKWQDTIRTCAASGVDGLLLSHGNKDGSYDFLKQIQSEYPKLKIVTFDTQFYSNGQIQTLPGVTQYFQQDSALASVLLDQFKALFPDKVANKQPIKVLKVWRGPNYNSPFDRREVGYEPYEKDGTIKTVETIQPTQDTAESTSNLVAAALNKYNRGDIDCVWVAYDEYGRGVYQAITESAKFKDLPMASVDIANSDISYMKQNPKIWVACGTTDWTMNGEIGLRMLALELANQYSDIYDPVTKQKNVAWVEVPATAIKASDLKTDTTLENLYQVADSSYGNKSYLSTCDWLKSCIGY